MLLGQVIWRALTDCAAEQGGLAILMRLQREREQEGAAITSRMQEGTSDSSHPAVQGQSPDPAGAGGVVATARLFGIGAAFKRRDDGFFYVHKVLVGGPAYKAGLEVLHISRSVSLTFLCCTGWRGPTHCVLLLRLPVRSGHVWWRWMASASTTPILSSSCSTRC